MGTAARHAPSARNTQQPSPPAHLVHNLLELDVLGAALDGGAGDNHLGGGVGDAPSQGLCGEAGKDDAEHGAQARGGELQGGQGGGQAGRQASGEAGRQER